MIPLRDDNPVEGTPYVTYALISSCILVFVYQVLLGHDAGNQFIYKLGVIPALLFDHMTLPPSFALVPAELTIVTSMFLHGGWMHLIGNLLYLWIFADNIEDKLGPAWFAVFYLACGVAAVFAQALPDPQSQIPMIGASGAISGVLGAYLILFPRARVLVVVPRGFYMPVARLSAALVLGLWFVIQIMSSLMAPAGSPGVAFAAHAGGFVAGVLLILPFRARLLRAPASRFL